MNNQIDIQEVTPDEWLANEETYKVLLKNPVEWNKVPLINCNALHHFQDGRLVRFRGMIQDMHNPEFYFESFELVNKVTKCSRTASGKYRDTGDVGADESINYAGVPTSQQRQTMMTISLPGLSKWARKAEYDKHMLPHLLNPPSTSKNGDPSTNLKRSLDDATKDEVFGSMDTGESADGCNKERKTTVNRNNQVPLVSHEHLLNFPLPDVAGKVSMMKVYDDYENFKLNDMVEVVGFLSVDPVLEGIAGNQEEEMDVEILTHNPPPSLVPRIHAVHIQHLSHSNPLLGSQQEKIDLDIKEATDCREPLRDLLTKLLFGDSLAADYLICHLISKVYLRRDVLTLGKFTLNLSGIPALQHPKYTEHLYRIIEELVTKSYYLPLSIDNMNTMTFLPKKDYDCNRLTSGILQLSKNTHLVLDETKMQPGKLDPTGVSNITALGNMIQSQKIQYDFKFYNMDFDCDIPTLVLSEGKSLLPSDFQVPIVSTYSADVSCLEIAKEIVDETNYCMNNEFLNKIRVYLTIAQNAEYSITDEPKYVQDDFVAMRRNVNGVMQNATQDDLHKLLVLARLVGLSRGCHTLTEQCWNIAKSMEEHRLARLQK